ncbi:GNAT family N-acetyltransferase [Psychrobacillus glaciei]|uniref:GNAT family N-acetyltransferase n=1 Tax=Psychrobacillus glaciei TaxID=2283160 RepID=A0A5J6SMW9_9BACI|nr:GNAT family N-acetyltransferase [Psychrobacillus glaciei]QFF99052.1 GNAT family N-acetyltransferase [Psychrobacillus glaciei]
MNYSIEVLLEENDDFSSFLKQKIKEFNNEQSVPHNEVRKKGSVQPINIVVMNDTNQWIGGITAEIYWNWLEINKFWFSPEFRGRGLGSLLLDKTERIAKDRGASKVLLTTFEFQARTFYETRGYKVVGEVKDYPPGSSYFTMVKTLI